MNSITLGILRGESYNGIRALVDLFVTLKYPTHNLIDLTEKAFPASESKDTSKKMYTQSDNYKYR